MKRGGMTAAIVVSVLLHVVLVVAVLWEGDAVPQTPEVEPVPIEIVELPPEDGEEGEEAPPPAPASAPEGEEAETETGQAGAPAGLPDTMAPASPVRFDLGTPNALEGSDAAGPEGGATESDADTPPTDTPPTDTAATPEATAAPAESETTSEAAHDRETDEPASDDAASETEAAEGAPSETDEPMPLAALDPEASSWDGPTSGTATEPLQDPAEHSPAADEPSDDTEPLSERTPPDETVAETVVVPMPNPQRQAAVEGTASESGESDGASEAAQVAYTEAVRRAIAPGFFSAMRTVSGSGVVVIEVAIERSGRVQSAELMQSSGSPALDAASLKAAREAPYPPLPPAVVQDPLRVLIPLRAR
ncbi:energy transducer TonB [Acuticoccus mangrovi]|uniref:TonB family protein n=1 Tax=Acuticoccus mangrovi TaxID=2796142 RepID=A0A934MKQ8_9HYPH|nr:TonB family protein [Acuticoccus mangrovi]MBJ3775679.1 TonB family protein [Acuticoccus mangrovi]